jgi:tyrosinase
MVVSLGPKSPVVNNIPRNPQADGMGANPRCLRRDVNKYSAAGATANYTLSLILNNTSIDSFYNRYLGQPPLKNDPHPWGVSPLLSPTLAWCRKANLTLTASQRRPLHDRRRPRWRKHLSPFLPLSLPPPPLPSKLTLYLQDFYASPGDPAFYFHHGMLDRVWWIWQMQDPDKRIDLIPGAGAIGMFGMGGGMRRERRDTAPGDTIVDLGWLAPPVKLSKLNDNLGGNDGQFCYYYV